MSRTNGSGKPAASAGQPRRDAGAAQPGVSAEERRRLATACAFFKAEQCREASPDTLRESDIEIAEETIESTLAKLPK